MPAPRPVRRQDDIAQDAAKVRKHHLAVQERPPPGAVPPHLPARDQLEEVLLRGVQLLDVVEVEERVLAERRLEVPVQRLHLVLQDARALVLVREQARAGARRRRRRRRLWR